jgi:outer membrane protein OmpA-like peptidoglycan-associated protein
MRLRRFRAQFLLLGALVAWLAPTEARAQRGIDSELFRPALDSYGIFTVERADVSHQWDFGFRLYANFAGNPLRLTMTDPTDGMHARTVTNTLMDRQIVLNLGMHLGLTNWMELALDFPMSAQNFTAAYGSPLNFGDPSLARTGFYAADRATTIRPPDAAAMDARLALKFKFFRKGIFGLGAAAIVTVPFGDDANFLGDTNFTFQPKIIGDITRGPITAAINFGAIIRQETRVYDPFDQAAKLANPRLIMDVGDELTWSAGLAYRFVHWVGIGAEIYGLIPLVGDLKDFTADVVGGLQFFPTKDLVVAAGAGAGIIPGAQRHDEYRVFLGITWAPVEGGKGTAVGGLDSDNDGIPDAQDVCPNEPEDRDGFDDDDGCPDPDNDQDGIPDKKDKCPNEPEDKDGFQDDDGCPETDNDGDGIPDAQDKCPNDPEDRDGFQDDDGCPDADNDGDGIPDAADKCPNEPETRNGVDDDDGCPDTGGAVVVTGTKIELPDQIQFETGRATLVGRSEALLDRVADKIKANANVKRIRIEGHTDDVGSPKKNQELSQERAESVRNYLMKRGVEADRLQAVGYGNSRPLDKRKTAEARAKNRRVEFIIVEQ